MLKQYRVTSMSLENDVKVTIEEKVFVRIPADKDTGDQEAIEAAKKARTEALEFLMNHGARQPR